MQTTHKRVLYVLILAAFLLTGILFKGVSAQNSGKAEADPTGKSEANLDGAADAPSAPEQDAKPAPDAKGKGKAPAAGPAMMAQAPKVPVAKVTTAIPNITRDYRGVCEAIERVRTIARVSGNLVNITFKEGDMIDKGALLFEIEDTEYVANLKAAEAQVVSCSSIIDQNRAKINEITARTRYAETNLSRVKTLFERGKASSEDDVDNAQTTLDSSKAQLESAKAALTDAQAQLELAKAKVDLAKFSLSHTKIYSPIKGRAGRLSFTQGNFITPNDGALIVIAQIDPIYIRFSISETDFVSLFGSAKELCEETTLEIRLADNSVYPGKGKIKFIDNEINSSTDTLQVWAEFENPDGLLNPQGIAKVILSKPGTEELPAIPASAILHDKTGEFVYLLGEGNVIEKRTIVLGAANGNTQCVTKGLNVGDVVLSGGTNKVMPGIPVDPVFETEETPSEGDEANKTGTDASEALPAPKAATTSPATDQNDPPTIGRPKSADEKAEGNGNVESEDAPQPTGVENNAPAAPKAPTLVPIQNNANGKEGATR